MVKIMKKSNPFFKRIKTSLRKKLPKSKGTDQIGDRLKLLAQEVLDSKTTYDEALVRAAALYLRREQHLRDNGKLDRGINYIQLFLNETKQYKDTKLINPAKKTKSLDSNYQPNLLPTTNSEEKVHSGEITILRAKGSNVESKSTHFLSNEMYKQYKQGITIIFTKFSLEKLNALIELLETNKESLGKVSTRFIGNLDISEINELSKISKRYNIELIVLDNFTSFKQIMKGISTRDTSIIDFDSNVIDINIEECLSKTDFDSLVLPSQTYDNDPNVLLNNNYYNGAVIPTYLLGKYSFKDINNFTFNLLLIRLIDSYDLTIRTYSSKMDYSPDLTLKEKVDYIQTLSSLSLSSDNDVIAQKLENLYAGLGITEPNTLLSIAMQRDADRVDFKKAFPNSFNDIKTLVIAYNFTPFVDPSAIVVAKRIQEEEWYSDVICNDMTAIRSRSESLAFIGKPYINSVITIESKPTFAHQPHYQEFVDKSIEILDLSNYEQVYSRSFFVAAHFLGFEVKAKKPEVTWLAEFSDPGVFDVQGNKRYSWFRDLAIRDRYARLVYDRFPEFKKYRLEENDNIYFWSEVLPFIFADKIMFTCENQRRVMLNNLEIEELIAIVEKKSVVKPQPTLPEFFYSFNEVENNIEAEYINIAYFGSFYINRNFNDIFAAINRLSLKQKQKIKLHIYTNQIDDVIKAATEYDVLDTIVVCNYLGYLDFLNVLDKFDCLFLMDTNTNGTFEVNPYLPSKLSDYLGAKANIWAHCERGSSLSKHKDIAFKSYIDTPSSIDSVMNNLFSSERV